MDSENSLSSTTLQKELKLLSQRLYQAHTNENNFAIGIGVSRVRLFLMDLLDILLGGIYTHRNIRNSWQIQNEINILHLRLTEILQPFTNLITEHSFEIANSFFSKLPDISESIQEDAEAAFRGDPAAETRAEVILAYPGFLAVAIHRIAHVFHDLQVKVFPRILSEFAHEKTGIDIHPGAKIGKAFFMDHGTGIVIGETTVIGENVKIYQGVTLGALSVNKELAKKKRHPTIKDNVVIYAGATILGGSTVIGKNSVIGGGVWLTDSVLPNSIVVNQPQTRVRAAFENSDVIDFTI